MEIKINMAGKEQVVKALGNVAGAMTDLTKPLQDLGERLVRRIGQRLSGPALKEGTGRLKGSLTYQAAVQSLTVSAGGGADLRYARIHHYGGTIKPKNAKFLTIPFPGGPADRPVPRRASDFINTFVAKGIIFQKNDGGKPTPLFILKKSVDIPARPYMYVEDSDIQYLDKSIGDYIAGKWQ